jgi:TnpA family transposase
MLFGELGMIQSKTHQSAFFKNAAVSIAENSIVPSSSVNDKISLTEHLNNIETIHDADVSTIMTW